MTFHRWNFAKGRGIDNDFLLAVVGRLQQFGFVHERLWPFTVVHDRSRSFIIVPGKKTDVIVRGHYFNAKLDKAGFTLRAAK